MTAPAASTAVATTIASTVELEPMAPSSRPAVRPIASATLQLAAHCVVHIRRELPATGPFTGFGQVTAPARQMS
jgi:hypothetical protein